MIVLVLTLSLYAIMAALFLVAARRKDGSFRKSALSGIQDFKGLVLRLVIGVIGAGFLARLLPEQWILVWLGPGSGLTGSMLACLAGAFTPGGPVVGFALGSAAMKSGAGMPQVMAYVTGWSLFALNRVMVWELPAMPRHIVWQRFAISLPLPLFVALVASWLSG